MTSPSSGLRRRFRREVFLARIAAAVERAWPSLYPVFGVAATFLILSLFGVWVLVPAWLHALGIAAFAGALGWALWRSRQGFAWPDRNAALGRLERINALDHQPLRSLEDRLSGLGDQATESLWQLHQRRLYERLGDLQVGFPESDIPKRDPWAFRAALLLVLVVAVVEAGSSAPHRLMQAFNFQRSAGAAEMPVTVTVWVTPPDYTRRAPLELKPELPDPTEAETVPAQPTVSVPVGSEVLAQLHGLSGEAAAYRLDLGSSGRPFAMAGGDSAEASLTIETGGALVIASPTEDLGSWQIVAEPDEAPTVSFAEPPRGSQRNALETHFQAEDDYGLASVSLLMRRPGNRENVERLELIRPSGGVTAFDETSYLDLTPHRWAGLPVVLQLEAEDGIEQRGWSDEVEVVLPERIFSDPVARALIEQRKKLAANPEQPREVASALNRMSQNPLLFREDPAVYLSMHAAVRRLMQADRADDPAKSAPLVEDVLELLWDTALHLEDGGLSMVERQLRDLQKALEEALAAGAEDAELEALLAELERAIQDYLEALMQEAQRQAESGELGEQQPIDPNSMEVRQQDLQEMLDRAREMIQSGARDAAREMLAQLQEMLENLQVARSGQMSEGQQMMNALQEMIQRQQGLLDQTFDMQRQQEGQQGQMGQQGGQQNQQGQMGQQGQGHFGQQGQGQPFGDQMQPGGQPFGRMAQDQEALRRALGELMRGLGEAGMPIPRALGEAELAMRSARDALEDARPGQALGPEAEALDQLRQGGQAVMEEMQRMMGQGQGPMAGQPYGANPDGRDPLGRSMFNQGGADLRGEAVPNELDLGRARAILEELHRRASERGRPAEELDYFERLLRRF